MSEHDAIKQLIPFTPASPATLGAFLAVTAAMLLALLAGIYVSSPRVGLEPGPRTAKILAGVLTWLALCAVFVASGVLDRWTRPMLPMFLIGTNMAAVRFARSGVGRQLALGVPIAFLVAFQGFRVPLELLLHSWALQGTVPLTMSWQGGNFDVFGGLCALLLAPLSARWRQAAWLANGIGIALLLNVIFLAVMSSPFPFAWDVHPQLRLAFEIPYFLIVPASMGGAVAGHIVLTRALLLRR